MPLADWGLVSHWKLNEASGTRADSEGSNNLTDNNTVTSDTGKIGNAALFTFTNSEFLSVATNSTLDVSGVDWWLACWVKLNLGGSAFHGVWGKNGIDSRRCYVVGSSGVVVFETTGPAGVSIGAATIATGTWAFLLAWVDTAQGKGFLRINGDAAQEDAFTTAVANTAGPFDIGQDGSDTVVYADGLIDSVSYGKPAGAIASIISEIHTSLYNGGNGRDYPFVGGGHTNMLLLGVG
jgi:hypothetical protein